MSEQSFPLHPSERTGPLRCQWSGQRCEVIVELEAEIARLKAERDHFKANTVGAMTIAAENERLRGLLGDVLEWDIPSPKLAGEIRAVLERKT